MNAIPLPRMLHSLPETRLLHNYGKASAPHFPLPAQLSTQLFSSWLLSSPDYLPVPSGALLSIPQCSPRLPMSLPRPETLASSSSLSYFFLPCVQVIITAPAPLSALLEACRPFSLSPLGLSQSLRQTHFPHHKAPLLLLGEYKWSLEIPIPLSWEPTTRLIYSKDCVS